MSEKEELWLAFYEIKYSECFAERYRARAARIDRWIACVTTLVSLSCVSTWWFWDHLPLVWSSLIVGSQLAMALKPYIPCLKYLAGLKYYIPDIQTLSLEASEKWSSVNSFDGKVSKTEIASLRKRHKDLGIKYFGDDPLPDTKPVKVKAIIDWELCLSKLGSN